MIAIRYVRDDGGSPLARERVFMTAGDTVESPTDRGLFATPIRPTTATSIAASVLRQRQWEQPPPPRLLLVNIDDADLITKPNAGELRARRLTVVKELNDAELEQLVAGDLSPLEQDA